MVVITQLLIWGFYFMLGAVVTAVVWFTDWGKVFRKIFGDGQPPEDECNKNNRNNHN